MTENKEICRIAIVGVGVMGGGLATALSHHHRISLYDKNYARASQLAEKLAVDASLELDDTIKEADFILLAVKPQDLSTVAKQLAGKIRSDQVLVSILGGIVCETLQTHFPNTLILRMMPNIACLHAEGVIAFADTGLFTAAEKKEFEEIFEPLGDIHWFPENKMNAVTSLAGSGPAFTFLIIEAIVDAGIALGLSAAQAKDIAIQMVLGAVTTLRETGKHPAELKWEVTSPGGCTIAGVKTFEENAVRSGIINTFLSIYENLQKV